eukprot:NODE_6152_length_370_cov_102.788162_g5433_i0.p1 GENE.NODE_6152_length_370_cov_102.788162_g5433_i0~~NODE_6152_length_370_cov_102.788162_g5433_i0.p1  ORF type:complete len:108 (+),score=26.26 NODE_6152_length_370_cov_102.788162_g5433_i0:17-340(+)
MCVSECACVCLSVHVCVWLWLVRFNVTRHAAWAALRNPIMHASPMLTLGSTLHHHARHMLVQGSRLAVCVGYPAPLLNHRAEHPIQLILHDCAHQRHLAPPPPHHAN